MKIKGLRHSLYLIFILACQQQPVTKWPMVMPEQESLTDKEKISLLSERSSSYSATGLAAIAQLYENQELFQNALTTIEDAIELDPMNSSYHSMKAEYAFRLGNKSVAYRESLTAYQLGSKSLKQRLRLAKMAVALSEFRIVGDMIDSLLIVYPQDPNVIYLAARKYEKDGSVQLAQNNYHKAYTINPNNQENNYYYSQFLANQEDYVGAKNIALKSGMGSDRQTCQLVAGIYYDLEQYDSAGLWFEKSLGFSIDSATYNLALKSYNQAGLKDSVTRLAKMAIKDFPDNRFYLYTAARNLDQRNTYDESLIYYLTLYKMDTLDTLIGQELAYLQRKIAYLQRRKREQKKLADSLAKALPVLTF